MGKALAITIMAAALTLAGCGSDGGAADAGSPATPRPTASATGTAASAGGTATATGTAAGGTDWQQISDLFAPEFRPSCTDLSGSAQGKCIGTLGKAAQSLLQLVEALPDGAAVSELRGDAQAIVDDAQAFADQACRSGAAGGCGAIPADVTQNAESIERTLSDAAG